VLFWSHATKAQKVTFFIQIAPWHHSELPSRITFVANSPLLRTSDLQYNGDGLNNGNTNNTTITAATALSLRRRFRRLSVAALVAFVKALLFGRLRGIEIAVSLRCSGFGCLRSLTVQFSRG
jgi:hypothetical protein